MKFRVFIFIIIFIQVHANAQMERLFSKKTLSQVFQTYHLKQQEYYGVFDNQNSILHLHYDSLKQSQFDSNCFLGNGKTWHRGQIVRFTNYITVDTFYQIEPETDSTTESFWAFDLPEVRTKGFQLWKCEGEFRLNEEIRDSFSGRVMGTFAVYVLFKPDKKLMIALPSDQGFGKEPGYLFTGFWNPYTGAPESLSFYVANTSPRHREDGLLQLPDLRFQIDGSSSFSNIVTFEPDILIPVSNWFQ